VPARRATEAIIWLAFAAAAVALAYALYVTAVVIALPAPQDYRESAAILDTDGLLRGRNLYAVENQPLYTNMYGIGYPLAVYTLARAAGSTFIVHRAVSVACVIASCALLAMAARRAGVDTRVAFAAAALLYCDLGVRVASGPQPALPQTILARPDALGLFLFLCATIVPWWTRFSTRGLVVSAACAIAGFFVKPYFVLAAPIVAAYVTLFVHRRRGIVFGVTTAIAGIALVAAATAVMPCYLANVVTGTRAASAIHTWGHLAWQLRVLVTTHPGEVALLVAAAVTAIRRREAEYFTFAAACSLLVLLRLGLYAGNSMIYFHHLLSPFLLMACAAFIAPLPKERRALPIAAILLDLLLIPLSAGAVPNAYASTWSQWRSLLADKRDVYVPPPLAWLAHEHGKPVYDTGLSDSFLYSMDSSIYPPKKVLRAQHQRYVDELADKVRTRRFDLIVLPYAGDVPQFTFLPTDLVARHYRPVGTLEMPITWQPGWVGAVFEPRPVNDTQPAR
jgi:hypothetical protein